MQGLPDGSVGKKSACNAGDPGSIPGSGRSPGEGNSNLLQYSSLENPMDRGACRATVHGVAKSQRGLNNFTFIVRILLLCSSFIYDCPCLRTSVRVVGISSYRILPIKMPQRIKKFVGTFLSVQRLRLHFFYAESMHSISGQGVKIPHAIW